jgi:hypothetical protein
MKYFIYLVFSLCCINAQAEDLLVPISKFDNDSQQLTNSRVLEFWGYHDYQGGDNYQNTLKLRYYNPLEAGEWKGRIRLDTAYVANFNSETSANNSGQYSAGNTMLTIWGQDRTFLKSLGALAGARLIFPFGNNGQWAVGPQLGWSFLPEVDSLLHVTDFSPLIRYMYGFDSKNNSPSINPNQPALQRNLQLFPTIGFQLTPNTMLRFWDENGAVYNSAGGGWFVPLDAMIAHRLAKQWVVAVGASKQVVQTYRQYDWSTYAKVSFNF